MRRPLYALAIIIVIAGALALLPPASGGTADDPEVTDEAGDARMWNSEAVEWWAQIKACNIVPSGSGCWPTTFAAREAVPTAGGVAAGPAVDAVAAWFEETPGELLVRVALASLDEGFSGAYDEHGGASYGIEWDEGGGAGREGTNGCNSGVWFNVGWRTPPLFGEYYAWDCHAPDEPPDSKRLCNSSFGLCTWYVPLDIAYGSPGIITWRVPRELLLSPDAGDEHLHPMIRVTWLGQAAGLEVGAGLSLRLATGETFQWGTAPDYFVYNVDDSGVGRGFRLAGERAPSSEPPAGAVTWSDPNDDGTNPPALDILETTLDESPEALSLEFVLGEVRERPEGESFFGEFVTPAGDYLAFSIEAGSDGAWQAGAWSDVYREGLPRLTVNVPTELRVEPGAPGSLRVAFDRADIGAYEAGRLYSYGWFQIAAPDPDQRKVPPSDLVEGSYYVDTDWSEGGDSMWLPIVRSRFDTPNDLRSGRQMVLDDTGDVRSPAGGVLPLNDPNQFDITYLAARALDTGDYELSLGIQELGRLAAPPLYDAVYYAVGVDAGDTATMVGFYKQRDDPAGTFLCAPDVTVLDGADQDPTSVVWTPIAGTVRATQGATSSGPGVFTFIVPPECLGVAGGTSLTLDRFEAGSFLIRNPTGGAGDGQLDRTDDAAAGAAIVLEGPEPLAANAVPWIEAPFGVAQFWGLFALAALIVVGAGAVAAKTRRRHLDTHALAEAKLREDRETYRAVLARLVATPGTDPGKDAALAALRRRLGISEREHALLEHEARAGAGVAVAGLPAGSLFLGKFRIERTLGEGGFARTYLARDEKLGRRVVLKVARWTDPTETKRALREGRILATLSHPNIVTVHDVEEVAGEVVLVLEHMQGGSLAQVLDKGALALPLALATADDVLAGLEAAHARGIVHRDVKPANILFTADRRAKLADFGVAAARSTAGTITGMTTASAGAGTLRYMAPEQARGLEAGAPSDLYALGVVLYEMITGRPYLRLQGLPEFEARRAILEEEPELPVRGVSPRVNEALRLALAKDPAERPASAADLRRMLAEGPAGSQQRGR